MSAILEPLGYAPLTPDETDQALDLIAIKPRSTAELVRRLSSTPAAIRAALEPLIQTGHLIRPPGGDWRPGERFGSSPGPRPAPTPRLPELEVPPPEDQPPSLQSRILALVAAEPGIAQAAVGKRFGAESQTSLACKYLEATGRIRREKILGSAALRLFPVAAPEPVPEQAAPEVGRVLPAPGVPSVQPPAGLSFASESPFAAAGVEPTEHPTGAPPLPEGEEPGDDCEGDGMAALSGWAKQLQDQINEIARLRSEIRAAWATLGLPPGRDLPAAILLALESARRALPLADAGETATLRARVAELEGQRDAANTAMLAVQAENSRWLAEIDAALDLAGTPRALGGAALTPPERARLLVWTAEREDQTLRDDLAAALAAETRLSKELSALEDAPAPTLAPRWVETAPGSWDLQALRPVTIAEIRREAGWCSWSISAGGETGQARSLERAKRRAAEAAAEGGGE